MTKSGVISKSEIEASLGSNFSAILDDEVVDAEIVEEDGKDA